MRIIAGRWGGRAIRSVSGPGYRPATGKVRGAVFSMLEARGLSWPGARVADLFAGTGSLGLEALSRGAAFALFVESAKAAAAAIRDTLADLGAPRPAAAVRQADVFAVLKERPARPFDAVFVDPPYGKDFLLPAVQQLMNMEWLVPGGFLLVEVEAGLDLVPDRVHADLETETDRLYGQTRIVLWTRSTR